MARARRCGWSRRMRRRRPRRAGSCPFAEVIVEPFGDIWLRDTGPIVLGSGDGPPRAGLRLQRLGRKVRTGGRPGHRRAARARGRPALLQSRLGPGGRRDRWRRQAAPCSPPSNACSTPTATRADARRGRAAAQGRSRLERVVWLGRGLAERPHGRPRRQSRPLRRAGPGGDPERRQRTIPTRLSTPTRPKDCATPSWTWSPCLRPAGSRARTASSSRQAT